MKILVTPTFQRTVKKLRPLQKATLDKIVKHIAISPKLGELKIGDLSEVYVYKFRMDNQLYLLAYRILDEEHIKLLMLGPHENFYRNLKRLD
ncbi:RelE/StbE family addiction module toxin [Achromatium sp. WMS3]|nr:RelE/StbE family addiction module toxin [Achromatium sp. WMS3]